MKPDARNISFQDSFAEYRAEDEGQDPDQQEEYEDDGNNFTYEDQDNSD